MDTKADSSEQGTDRRALERAGGAGGRSEDDGSSEPLWLRGGPQDMVVERNHSGIPVQCQYCGAHGLRRSRLRGEDAKLLLVMRYPVRCTRCSQRQAVSFTVAGAALPQYVRRKDRSGSGESGDKNGTDERRKGGGTRLDGEERRRIFGVKPGGVGGGEQPGRDSHSG